MGIGHAVDHVLLSAGSLWQSDIFSTNFFLGHKQFNSF
jgi:hypothetical protein